MSQHVPAVNTKVLMAATKESVKRHIKWCNSLNAQEITEAFLGGLDKNKVTVQVDQQEAYMYNGQNVGVFVESCIQVLDSCVTEKWHEGAPKGKVLNDIVIAIGQQWPFGKKRHVDADGNISWTMCVKNPWERAMVLKIKAAIDLNRERLQEQKESVMMKWNSGEREAGFAELCTSNAGISQYQRNEQEWDIWNRRADEVLLRAQEKNTGFLSPDPERFAQWHKALRILVSNIRWVEGPAPQTKAEVKSYQKARDSLGKMRANWASTTKASVKKQIVKIDGKDEVTQTSKDRPGKWNNLDKAIAKLDLNNREAVAEFLYNYPRWSEMAWAPSPKAVLMLLSWRIRTQLVLRHITYNQWYSLAEKVSRCFRALGCVSPKLSEKGLPGRDMEMISLAEESKQWSENRDQLSDWEEAAIMSEGLNPEELVSMMQEYQE